MIVHSCNAQHSSAQFLIFTIQNRCSRDFGSRRVTAPGTFHAGINPQGDYSRGDIFRRRLPAVTARISVGALSRRTVNNRTARRRETEQTDDADRRRTV